MMDCASLPQMEYGAFSTWMHSKVGNQRIPISGSIEVTSRCNLRCVHCYLPVKQRTRSIKDELSSQGIKHNLDEVADAGCLWLLLTGGDPFLRKDFLDIYAYARRKGLILTIFTNGTFITPRIADYLAEWCPFSLEITLYGATQATYEQVTGIPGSYQHCMRGIELLLERKLPLSLKTMVLTLNAHELGQMQSYAKSLGVGFKYDPIISPAMDGSRLPEAYRLNPEQILEIEQADRQRLESYRDEYAKHENESFSSYLYTCGAGRRSFHIDAFGNLDICLSGRKPAYNLRRGSFKEGWEQVIPRVIDAQTTSDYVCGNCAKRALCNPCPAKNELQSGDPQVVDPYACKLTHLRWQALNLAS